VPINERVKTALHYNANNGAAIAGVISGSPAANAGLKVGDVIQQIDGNNVGNAQQAVDYVSHQPPGKSVRLHVWSKGGHERNVNVKLTERPVE
jgi:S1-C subfamily serine protease